MEEWKEKNVNIVINGLKRNINTVKNNGRKQYFVLVSAMQKIKKG